LKSFAESIVTLGVVGAAHVAEQNCHQQDSWAMDELAWDQADANVHPPTSCAYTPKHERRCGDLKKVLAELGMPIPAEKKNPDKNFSSRIHARAAVESREHEEFRQLADVFSRCARRESAGNFSRAKMTHASTRASRARDSSSRSIVARQKTVWRTRSFSLLSRTSLAYVSTFRRLKFRRVFGVVIIDHLSR